jgi:2-polyprenyl-6-methoxyphenol hydroxylase-like FAD-dependent oxidoreductase
LKRMSPASAVTEKEEEEEGDVDDRLIRLTGQDAKDLSLFVARERLWDPSVLALLEGRDASQTAVLRTTSSDPAGPPLWESNERVTLLGDAVHCMPPTGGQGGNMALWDGALLGQELAEEWEAKRIAWALEDEQNEGELGWKWSRGTVRRYEDSMRAHTGDIVAMACIGATYLFGGEEVWQ